MRKRVLVCGATGFIGRNISEQLAQDPRYEVFGTYFRSDPFNNPGVTLIHADLTDPKRVARCLEGIDVVIQAAATTSGAKDIVNQPYIHVTDNAVMNSHLFRAAHDLGVKQVVFFSCTVMYPSQSEPLKESDFDANHPIFPNYFGVGWTKVYLEKMAEFYSRLGKTRYTVLRHSNIYGPHDKFDLERSHVFGATLTKVLQCQNGTIDVWGDGSEERDLLYVSDLVDFVARAIEKQTTPFELTNVGAGYSIRIRDLVQSIIDQSGKSIELRFDKSKPTLKTRLCLDTSKAFEDLGWKPQISLSDGIRKTLEWVRANPDCALKPKRKSHEIETRV